MLLLAVEVRLLAVLRGGVELWAQVLELLHARQTQVTHRQPKQRERKTRICRRAERGESQVG